MASKDSITELDFTDTAPVVSRVASYTASCDARCGDLILPDDIILFDGDGWVHEECA